ncbi:hypothetical protein [Nocardiopsis sp. NPDC006938]|uniref:hypothetical protein n=1 Tax=Nocardiopsis sp. NPDC006938 TaxID=3364337 RepID=UPI0036BDDAEA
MDDQPIPRPRRMGARPRRPQGLGRTAPAGVGDGAAPGLARLLGGDPLIALTTTEASLVLDLLGQVDALAAVTGRQVDPDAAALAAKLRSHLDDRSA